MLLRFFRINDPYRLIGLLVLLVLISLPAFFFPATNTLQELRQFVLGESVGGGKWMYVQIIDQTPPLMALVLGVINWITGRNLPAQHLLALIFIFFQASYFAILLINNKAYNDSTYVPALIFALLCFVSFDLLSFSPELIGSTLLLMALNNLFKEIEFRIERDEIVLNLGIYLGLASLVIFSFVVFLLASVFILFVFTRLTIRKLALLLFGFFLPHGLLICFYFFKGEAGSLFHHFYLPNLTIGGHFLPDVQSLLLLGALPLFYFVMSLFMLNREAHFTKYQSQLFQVMFQWLLVCFIFLFVAQKVTPSSFLVFVPSLAYFISHYLLLIRRRWIASLMLWFFILGIISINLLARNGKLKGIQYAPLFPRASIYGLNLSGKSVMVLADDQGIYQRNRMAGYFFDWGLSKEVFEQPDYYENVLLVAEAFRTDSPDVVIDPLHLLGPFLDRIPELRSEYVKDGIYYRKKEEINN